MVEHKRLISRFLQPLLVGFIYLFLYLPIMVLVLFSFNKSFLVGEWTGFSLRWYRQLLDMPELLASLEVSLVVAFCATVLSVFMGTAFVYATKWWKSPYWSAMFYANVIAPDIILGIGLLSLFSLANIPLGYGSLIAGHTLLGLGFVVPIVRARFHELEPTYTEASADLGATHMQTFRNIIIPLLGPSLLAAGLLVFTLSLDDFLIAFFCSSPRVQTLSVYVYSMVREGVDPSINAISVCLLIISSLFVLWLSSMKILEQVISHE